jgi:hypothetical protein
MRWKLVQPNTGPLGSARWVLSVDAAILVMSVRKCIVKSGFGKRGVKLVQFERDQADVAISEKALCLVGTTATYSRLAAQGSHLSWPGKVTLVI